MSKSKASRKRKQAEAPPNAGRRQFMILGLGSLAVTVAGVAGYKSGLFTSAQSPTTSPVAPPTAPSTSSLATAASPAAGQGFEPIVYVASRDNALRAAEEITEYYARFFGVPSPLIHAVRGMGKNFKLSDGTNAVDFLCSRFAAEKQIDKKRYIYFPRQVEVHDNSFLKTFLEAGVSLDQPITVGANKYTLRDLGDSAKALFRCDPQNLAHYDPDLLHTHLPWGLIAFSILMQPKDAVWTNAFGETINLSQVIDRSLAAYENSCSGASETIAKNGTESAAFHTEIKEYSCFGTHAVYGFLSCLNHGYRSDGLPERTRHLFDLMVYRLQGDPGAINQDYEAAAKQGVTQSDAAALKQNGLNFEQAVEAFRVVSQIKFFGHAFECINYVKLHRLFPISSDQQKRIADGEQMFYDNLVKLRAMNLESFRGWNRQFVCDVVVALGHAVRGMKLLTPQNPDTLA